MTERFPHSSDSSGVSPCLMFESDLDFLNGEDFGALEHSGDFGGALIVSRSVDMPSPPFRFNAFWFPPGAAAGPAINRDLKAMAEAGGSVAALNLKGQRDINLSVALGLLAAEVATMARGHGVSWIAPTVHCSQVRSLALIAELMDVNYPSYSVVSTIEDKSRFYDVLRGARLAVPRGGECETAEQIEKKALELAGRCVLKSVDDHSSMGLQTLDTTGGRLTAAGWEAIAEHLKVRDARRIGVSMLNEFVGDREFGLQAMLRVSREKGVEIVWSMSTRKIIVQPLGRLAAHIYDPADKERIEMTRDLLLPTIQCGLDELFSDRPDVLGDKVGQYVLNADIRSDASTAWWIDGSFRWAPRFARTANATVGVECGSHHFPMLAYAWARGRPINLKALQPKKDVPQRAFIMQKAFMEGGRLVRLPVPETASQDGVFYDQQLAPGMRLRGPSEPGGMAIADYPLVCAEGATIGEATQRWHNGLAAHGYGVERDGVVYDAYSIPYAA